MKGMRNLSSRQSANEINYETTQSRSNMSRQKKEIVWKSELKRKDEEKKKKL